MVERYATKIGVKIRGQDIQQFKEVVTSCGKGRVGEKDRRKPKQQRTDRISTCILHLIRIRKGYIYQWIRDSPAGHKCKCIYISEC